MTRVFDSQGMVSLPVLDVSAAIALTTALLAAAATEKKLPPRVERARHVIEERLAELQTQARAGLMPVVDSTVARQADMREDAAFKATRRWLLAWASLPAEVPEVQTAQRLHDLLFPDGLRFTQLPYRDEWVAAQQRLDLLDQHNLAGDFDALGGGFFLTTLREVHAQYGESLGLTKPTAEPSRAVGGARDLLLAGLRGYVLQVVAHADPEQPATEALSDRLLAPLAAWQSRPRAAAKSTGSDGGTTTTTPATAAPETSAATEGSAAPASKAE